MQMISREYGKEYKVGGAVIFWTNFSNCVKVDISFSTS
jgi:hypothetical protein